VCVCVCVTDPERKSSVETEEARRKQIMCLLEEKKRSKSLRELKTRHWTDNETHTHTHTRSQSSDPNEVF